MKDPKKWTKIGKLAFYIGIAVWVGDFLFGLKLFPEFNDITSFIVAGASLAFSMITYWRIDVLNNITSMEGNVLDNKNYTVSYEEIIDDYADQKDQNSFSQKLVKSIELSQNTKSCIDFADCLQNILDHLVLFGYVNFSDVSIKNECENLIKNIQNEANRYEAISNGIKYQLDENIKLIEYVFNYQERRNKNDNSQFSKLENIRGGMLSNPVSQVLYYNYLGLDYKNKVIRILKVEDNIKDEFGIEWLKFIICHDYSTEEMLKINCLIDRADKCLQKAYEKADDNILWDGYISYNKVRIDILKYLLKIETDGKERVESEEKKIILKRLDDVIRKREEIKFLFDRTDSYLNVMFDEEIKNATKLKNNFNDLLNQHESI